MKEKGFSGRIDASIIAPPPPGGAPAGGVAGGAAAGVAGGAAPPGPGPGMVARTSARLEPRRPPDSDTHPLTRSWKKGSVMMKRLEVWPPKEWPASQKALMF